MVLLVPPYSDMRIFSLELSEEPSYSCLASSINAAEHEAADSDKAVKAINNTCILFLIAKFICAKSMAIRRNDCRIIKKIHQIFLFFIPGCDDKIYFSMQRFILL